MAVEIVIHAGQHKTGSTSIQHYLADNREFFQQQGIFACPAWTSGLTGLEQPVRNCNAGAIAHAIVRETLATPGRLRAKHPVIPEPLRRQGIARVNRALRAVPERAVILSSEAFSFLRQPEEFARIEELCTGLSFRAVMFLRDPRSWRESWRLQLAHAKLIERPGAVADCGIFDFDETSWLTDHQAIRNFWRGHCTFLAYEEAREKHGSVIPAFLGELGLDPAACPGWDGFFLNASNRKLAADRRRGV
jgi:hypothetical protein